MLLPRIRRVLPLRQWCTLRTFADAVPKYSPKVRGRTVWCPSPTVVKSNFGFVRSTSLRYITGGRLIEHEDVRKVNMFVSFVSLEI
jgi:hypothetical protein